MRKKAYGKWKILFAAAIILMFSAQIQLMAGASIPMEEVFSGDIKEDTAVYLEQGGSRYGYQSLQDREYQVQKQELYRDLQDASYPVLESNIGRDAWHSVAGVLAGNGAVCEGYAKTLQLLLNLSGIPSVYVIGDTGGTRHAWNIARMEDGQWYLLDATWDDSAGNMGYFLSGSDGVHIADVPGKSGTGYFYQLPGISDEKYFR